MTKMIEVSEIVVKELVKETGDAATLLYHLSNRCEKARKECRNPDETFQLLDEVSRALSMTSRVLEHTSSYLDERLLELEEPKAA